MSTTQDNWNRADREKLKTYFETGDRPTEEEFSQTIDSWINQLDDDIHAVDQKIGIGTDIPKSKLHVKSVGGDPVSSDGILTIDSSGIDEGSIHFGVLPNDFAWMQSQGKIPLRINPLGNNTLLNGAAGNVGIGTNKPIDKLQVGEGLSKVVLGSAYGENTGWGSSYLGFNLGRKQGTWYTDSDVVNNGGAVIYGDVSGNIRFSTVKSTQGAAGISLTDLQVRDNTKLFIASDGNVGVGTTGPTNKLHVHKDGITTGLKLSGQTGALSGDILTLDGTGNAKWLPPSSVTSGLWKAIGTTGHIENGNTGNVGVGTNAPESKLHVHHIATTTGLKLSGQTGALSGDILTLDGGGNAKWLPPTSVTSGLWKAIGTTGHIENGNTGNVGVGTNAPEHKLHIKGSLRVDSSANDVVVFNDTNYPNGSVKNANPFTIIDQTGSRGFRFWSNANANNSAFESIRIEPAGHLRLNSHNIFLRAGADQNHGLGWVDKDVFDNRPKRPGMPVATITVDGPFLFGFQGGVLGTNDYGSKNIALQWFKNKSVDFKGTINVADNANFNGDILVKGQKPFIRKRYIIEGNEKTTIKEIADYPPQFYDAIIAGVQFHNFTSGIYANEWFITRIDEKSTLKWEIEARFPEDSQSKQMKKVIDILFIRKELISRG